MLNALNLYLACRSLGMAASEAFILAACVSFLQYRKDRFLPYVLPEETAPVV